MGVVIKNKSLAMVLLSGGIDSAACAHFFLSQGYQVESLFIDYGQLSSKKEALAAKSISTHLSIPIRFLSLVNSLPKKSDEILGRNAFLLFTALMEFPGKHGIIGIGIHSESPYYDCSEKFLFNTNKILENYSNGCIAIGSPFQKFNKAGVWSYFEKTGIPVNLTYSCELGLNQPCGSCVSCKDLEALNVIS